MSIRAKFQQDRHGVRRLSIWADTVGETTHLLAFMGRNSEGEPKAMEAVYVGQDCWSIYRPAPEGKEELIELAIEVAEEFTPPTSEEVPAELEPPASER